MSDKEKKLIDEFHAVDPDTDENEMFTRLGILNIKEGNEFKKVGAGIIRILENKTNHRCRIVMRSNGDYTPLLNHWVFPSSTMKAQGEKVIQWTTKDWTNGKERTVTVGCAFMSKDAADDFVKVATQAKTKNAALLKDKNYR